MTTQEFLSENRQEVINYFNDEISGNYNISLRDFMTDLMNNFKKVTISEDLKKFDLVANLQQAKSRLGMSNNIVAVDNITNRLRSKYQNTAYMSMI